MADRELAGPLSTSEKNLFLAQRFALLESWEELSRYAPRQPTGTAVFGSYTRPDNPDLPMFAADGARYMTELLPLSALVKIAGKTPGLNIFPPR